MDWTLVTRSTKQRRRTAQIFVKVDGSRTIMMEMALSDKVSDIVKRIPTSACCSNSEVYAMCERKVLRQGEEWRKTQRQQEESGEEAERKSSQVGADARRDNGR